MLFRGVEREDGFNEASSPHPQHTWSSRGCAEVVEEEEEGAIRREEEAALADAMSTATVETRSLREVDAIFTA